MKFSGGIPHIREATATSGAPTEIFPPTGTCYAQIHNQGSAVVDVWFDDDDRVGGVRSIPLQASGSVGDYWEGPAKFFPISVPNAAGNSSRGPVIVQSQGANSDVLVVFYEAA